MAMCSQTSRQTLPQLQRSEPVKRAAISKKAEEKVKGSIAAKIGRKAKVNRKENKAEGTSFNGKGTSTALDGETIIPAAVGHRTCEWMVS